MKIRKLVAILMVLSMVLAFAATGSAETGFTPALDASTEMTLTLFGPGLFATVGEKGSINLTSGLTTPGYGEIAAHWNEYYPNVKLEISTIPWTDWQANVTTAVMGGDVDIILHGATLADLCEDLQTYVDATEGFMDEVYLVASRQVAGTPNVTKVSGMPYTVTPLLAYIDTQLFKEFGVELPTADWTWEDLLAIAQKLTGVNPVTGEECYGYKFTSRNGSNLFYANHMMIAQAYGGGLIKYGPTLAETTADYKSEPSMKAFEMIAKLSETLSPDDREGIVDATTLLADNKVAIRVEQNPFDRLAEAKAAGDENRWLWMTLPTAVAGEGAGKPSYMLGENNMAIAYNSDAKEWAWEFIRFMTTDNFVQDWLVRTRNLPNNITGQTLLAPTVGADKAATMYAALENLPYGWNNATNDCINSAFLGTLPSDMYVALDSVVKGEMTPAEAAEFVQSSLDAFLAAAK